MRTPSRHQLSQLGYGLLILAVCLPLSVLVWRATVEHVSGRWQRYSDRQLGISWSAPADWELRALGGGSERTLVMNAVNGPRAVLYLSASSDQAAYRRWDPAAATTQIAGLPASDTRVPAGQNPAQRLVAFRAGQDTLVLLALYHSAEFDQAVFDRLLASITLSVEEDHIRVFMEVDSLSSDWQACSPDCGLSASSPNWCGIDATAAEWDGVDVYSNGSNFPYFYENECPDFYGLKFQCVELIQRYYWERVGRNTGTGSPGWGIASAYQAWWQHPPEYERLVNGSGAVPQAGDILVWRPEGRYAPHGHVGIVVQVSNGQVVFVQQNSKEGGVSTRSWVNGWIDDPYLYGWLRLTYGDHMPPDGAIAAPEDAAVVTGDILHLEGWAEDTGTGLVSAQFYAVYGDTTLALGEPFSASPFTFNWNLAANNIPNGPVTITLRLQDKAGNVAYSPQGVRRVEIQRPSAGLEPIERLGDCHDLVANGSFELNRNWLFTGSYKPAYTASAAVVGEHALQLGIVEGASLNTVSIAQQIITIPADADKLRLRFKYQADASPYAMYPQRVVLIDAEGNRHTLLALNGPHSYARGWREVEIDESVLGQFRGQKVRLQFIVYNNGWEERPASLLVDDLHLYACQDSATPTAEPTESDLRMINE
ncbi:MAG: CHAP domain-containing protein [Chloroflexi bacterium]|nr:CHAP domain-containing protein [Chloroflexota bacterium]